MFSYNYIKLHSAGWASEMFLFSLYCPFKYPHQLKEVIHFLNPHSELGCRGGL